MIRPRFLGKKKRVFFSRQGCLRRGGERVPGGGGETDVTLSMTLAWGGEG